MKMHWMEKAMVTAQVSLALFMGWVLLYLMASTLLEGFPR